MAGPSRAGGVGVDAELYQLPCAAGMSYLSQAGPGVTRQLSSGGIPDTAPCRCVFPRELVHRLPQHRPLLPELPSAIRIDGEANTARRRGVSRRQPAVLPGARAGGTAGAGELRVVPRGT